MKLSVFLLLQTAVFGIHVSVYYYPWYTGIANRDVLRYELIPEQPPVLGSYRSDDPDVVDQHLQWSEDYCIDNWISSWWGPGHRTDDNALDVIAPALNESEVTYNLFYESTNRVGMGDISGSNINQMRNDVAYMARIHFGNPSYYKIDGKPVIYIYLTRTFTGSWAEGFEAMREGARNEGYDDVYLVGDENYWGELHTGRTGALDAITAYNMHGPAKYDGWPMETGMLSDIEAQFNVDKEIAEGLGTRFITTTSPGFNDRVVRDGHYPIPRRVHADSSHTSTFEQYFDVALRTMDSELEAITINSWNEWMEDSNIEPVIRSDATSDDSQNDNYTLGYEYVGYDEDHLQVILDKTGCKTVPVHEQVKPALRPFTVIFNRNPVKFEVDFSVERVHVFDLHGSLLGTRVVSGNLFEWDNNPEGPGVILIGLEGAGSYKAFKILSTGTFEGKIFKSRQN